MKVAIIGCTGSVGSSVVDVCRAYPDQFEIVALAANKSCDAISSLAQEFKPSRVVLSDKQAALEIKGLPINTRFSSGTDQLVELARSDDIDHVVFASSGTDAIPALKVALETDKDVSLANKESIVVAGKWILPHVTRPDQIRPLDSEHNAIWQCLIGENKHNVLKIALTASGGPFRTMPLAELDSVTPEMATAHPVWSMGEKISVDSATLINKGIEIIEAIRLFDLPPEMVNAYIHPGSSAHGMVEFIDNSIKMLLAPPDMRISALTAMAYPRRLSAKPLSIESLPINESSLDFELPDILRYPGYYLALEVAKAGGSYPTVLVGADEVAVEAFLNRKIAFTEIWKIIERVLDEYDGCTATNLEEELDILERTRRSTREICYK